MRFALLNAKTGRGLSKIPRFNGRFGVGNFVDFSINFTTALKKHQKNLTAAHKTINKKNRQASISGQFSKK
jgi:hypothetical protein